MRVSNRCQIETLSRGANWTEALLGSNLGRNSPVDRAPKVHVRRRWCPHQRLFQFISFVHALDTGACLVKSTTLDEPITNPDGPYLVPPKNLVHPAENRMATYFVALVMRTTKMTSSLLQNHVRSPKNSGRSTLMDDAQLGAISPFTVPAATPFFYRVSPGSIGKSAADGLRSRTRSVFWCSNVCGGDPSCSERR